MSVADSAQRAARRLLSAPARVSPTAIGQLSQTGLPGLYAWFADAQAAADISAGLGVRVRAGLIYAGQAGAGVSSATLGSRIRGNHIAGNVYGSTFRLTLASCLFVPLGLEPVGRRRIAKDGEARLTDWMTKRLKVSILGYHDRVTLNLFETDVLALLSPPLNIAKLPPTSVRRRLIELRRRFTGTRPAADPLGQRVADRHPAPRRKGTSTAIAQSDRIAEINRTLLEIVCSDGEVSAVEANAELARRGLLLDSETRRGLPLRRLLRAGLIENAVQEPNGRWFIRCPN